MTSKVMTLGLIALFAIFGSIAMAGAAKKDIVTTAVDAGSFTTLAKALKAANLVEVLQGKGPYTVFAPTDEAFAKLPAGALENLLENPDKLKQVLLLHVVPGKLMASEVVKMQKVKTVEGAELSIMVHSNQVMVDNATVTKTDILASNGVIHVIDSVILPN